MQFPRPPRLTDQEIAWVESHLARSSGPIRDFEMLDGFFAALVTGPELLMPSQFLPVLLGERTEESPMMADMDEAQAFLAQLMNHWNRLVTTFMAGEPWAFWLRDPESPTAGRWWTRGFVIGMDQGDGWDALARQREHGPLFYAVLALANEDSPDTRLHPGPIWPSEREGMLGAIAYGLPALYAATHPDAFEAPAKHRAPPRAKAPKAAKSARKPKAAKKTRPRRPG